MQEDESDVLSRQAASRFSLNAGDPGILGFDPCTLLNLKEKISETNTE
jgi:hypothetical protein